MGLFSKSDDELIAQLSDKSEDKRRKAIQQLRDRKSPKVAAALARAIPGEANGFNISDLTLALRMIADPEAVGDAVDPLLRVWATATNRMSRDTELNRSQIAYALGTLGSPLLFEALAAAAGDPWPTVRQRAYVALGNLEIPWAFDVLRRGLDDVDDLGRRYAIEGMGHLLHPGTFQTLQGVLGSSNFDERSAAEDALASLARVLGATDLTFRGCPDRDMDTLGRLIHARYCAYATESGTRWVERRKDLALHYMTDRCLSEFSQALGPVLNSYERVWTESVLKYLRAEAARMQLHDRVEAIDRLAAVG